ncbi:GFA family protein [Chitinivorax sp. B]|uniref:GFA family protein n=1 Tax=Chitinivorax sp. B TaxID=2502235 RepID=UPI0010F9436B|nr:GFA family protein [Chitinivorax sp. B]
MNKVKTYAGGCLCGAIRFVASGPALNPHTCSCKRCQRHSGALTQIWVEFPKDSVQWVGAGGMPATWRSSAYSSRAFCSNCGSTLGAIDDNPTIALVLGVFDSPNSKELAPTKHSFVSKRPKWWRVSSVITGKALHNPSRLSPYCDQASGEDE